VNKDNFLFLVIGSLCGFLAGYMIQERMAKIQPQPLIHGDSQAQVETPGQPSAGPGPGGGAPNPRVRQLSQRLAANPQDTEALRELADMNFDIRNWSRAAELYESFLEISGEDSDVLTDLGICYRAEGRFDEALATFEKALQSDGDSWLARYNKTIVLGLDLGDYSAAGEVLAELNRIRPDDPDVTRLADEIERRRKAG